MKNYLCYAALCLAMGTFLTCSGCFDSGYTGSGSKDNIVSSLSDFKTFDNASIALLSNDKEGSFVEDSALNEEINSYIGASEQYYQLSASDLTYCPNATGYTAMVGSVSGTDSTIVASVPSWYLDKPVTAVTTASDDNVVLLLEGDMAYVRDSEDSHVLLCYQDKCIYGYAAHDYASRGGSILGGATAFCIADDGMLIVDDKLVAVNFDWIRQYNDRCVLTIPDNVTTICSDAFKYSTISSPRDSFYSYYITCPDNIKIESSAFSGLNGVLNVHVTLGKNADIAPYAFAQSEFDTLYIDDTVNKIPFEAFESHRGTVELSDNVQLIGNTDNVTCTFTRSGSIYGGSSDKTYADLLEDIRLGS